MSRRLLALLAGLVALVAVVAISTVVVLGLRDSPPGSSSGPVEDPGDPAWDVAVSTPVEDSYYPDHGDPGVDALHYGLDLTWEPDTATLSGTANLVLRATTAADHLQLDLLDALRVSRVEVDGTEASYVQGDQHLVVSTDVVADQRLLVRVVYAGTPAPVSAPTVRADVPTIGMNVTATGELWTMQEPYGAFTWYPVNDQPSDKALYDVTVRTPSDWVGVSNGVLESRRTDDGHTVTRWHLDQPAASYLTTLAVGDYVETTATSPSGVPLSYWTHRGDDRARAALAATPRIMAWNEAHLGPYPFASLGIVVVDSESGMETQTMITLGDTGYALSAPVVEHELTHQWYGDLVTPTDWRDLWMNEGLTMFVQGVYQAHTDGTSIDAVMQQWSAFDAQLRQASGPPGAYDPGQFGEGNVYYSPALMWNQLRHRVGDQEFWSLVRAWPAEHAGESVTRAQYYAWLEDRTGLRLRGFFRAWIMGATTPQS